ncbi:MAG: hypothetical protein AAF741_04730 [Bacteroidota bacterium]
MTLSFGVLGLLCLVATYLLYPESHHMRFWTNFLHNSVFFLGIALIANFVLAAFTTAYAGWYVTFKRVWESFALWLLPALFCMGVIIVGLVTESHHLYHWNDPELVVTDPILNHKSAFLNWGWYIGGTIIFGGIWYFFITKMRRISLAEDRDGGDANFSHHRTYRKYAAIFLPIVGFTSAAMIWQWVMSMDSHWYSTMFAWYATASWFLGMMGLTIMMMIYLKSRGYFPKVTMEHFHDLGKYLFAISIFWTYLWFSQYMLIWYANVGEETIYFRERLDNYRVLFYANLLINFLLPFAVLLPNYTKRRFGTLFFVSLMVFLGHWMDFFLMIKPAARITIDEHAAHADHGAGHGDHGDEHGAHGGDHSDTHVITSDAVDGHHGEEHHQEGEHHGTTESHQPTQSRLTSSEHGETTTHDEGHHSSEHHDAGHHGEEHHSTTEPRQPTQSRLTSSEHGQTGAHDEGHHSSEHDGDGHHGEAHYGDGNEHHDEGHHGNENPAELSALGQGGHTDGHHTEDTHDAAHGGDHGDDAHGGGHGHGGVDPTNRGFKDGYTIPGFWELGTFLGFTGFFLFFVLSRLEKAPLIPKNDPYLVESDHHHT